MTLMYSVGRACILILISTKVTEAGNLTLDCNGRVKAGEKTQVTCRGPNKLHSGMYIYRPNASNGNELVIRCKYDYGSCLNPIKSYTFQKRAGEVKVIIERFDPNTDVGKWVCCDGPFSGVNRNMATCMKKGNLPTKAPSSATTSVTSTTSVTQTTPVTPERRIMGLELKTVYLLAVLSAVILLGIPVMCYISRRYKRQGDNKENKQILEESTKLKTDLTAARENRGMTA